MKRLFVLFGATGDLAKRKIYPALKEIVEEKIDLLAIGRENFSKEEFIKKNISEKGRINIIGYRNTKEDFSELIKITENYDEVILYLSTPPKVFYEIVNQLSKHNLKDKKYKIAFEKPFGEDLSSFEKLNKIVLEVFNEDQIYRVDHYLGKGGVLEILKFRKNEEYEKYWNSKYIKSVSVIVKENIGIEKRAEYYDETGAIKDMIQSHLLQILSFVLMELSKDERKEKIKILESLKIEKENIVGQYKSYKEEEKVKKDSNTETFAWIKLKTDISRWKETNLSLITGKKLDKKETKVVINFFEKERLPKKIIFEIYPKEQICFEDGESRCKYYKTEIKEDYINIIKGIIDGKKEIFPSAKGLEASWKILDSIKKNKLIIYEEGYSEEDILKIAIK